MNYKKKVLFAILQYSVALGAKIPVMLLSFEVKWKASLQESLWMAGCISKAEAYYCGEFTAAATGWLDISQKKEKPNGAANTPNHIVCVYHMWFNACYGNTYALLMVSLLISRRCMLGKQGMWNPKTVPSCCSTDNVERLLWCSCITHNYQSTWGTNLKLYWKQKGEACRKHHFGEVICGRWCSCWNILPDKSWVLCRLGKRGRAETREWCERHISQVFRAWYGGAVKYLQ